METSELSSYMRARKDIYKGSIRMAVARKSLGDHIGGCEPIKGTDSKLEIWRESTRTSQSRKPTTFGKQD